MVSGGTGPTGGAMRNFSEAERADILATAAELADVARVATLSHFRTAGLAADNKLAAGFDPVTVADRLSEDRMRAVLARRRPQDGILGEERGPVAGTSGLTWVLDPIDGTRGYLSGTPTWGVLIALADADGPIYGIIDQPYIGERFEGGLGRAEVAGPMGRFDLRCRAARALAECILFTTFPEVGTPEDGAAFRRLASQVRLTRYGMDCYAYALVAAGQIDLVVEAGLQTYDVMAPIAVIEAAGGVVTDWQGGPVHMGGRVIAAANREVHAAALAVLRG
jgi:histidinol phosphatase-like enzyme (inositol monophosphatase family)